MIEAGWNQVEQFVEDVAREFGDVDGVYGPPRGGLVFAVMLSHRLGVPLLMAPTDGCLIVDDICDEGDTMLHYRKALNAKIATMFYVKGATVTPDMWMLEKRRGDWVIFPWEVRNG